MRTTLTQKATHLLRLGRLPAALRTVLESEGGIVYLAEGIGISATFHTFKAQGIRCLWRKMGFIGFVALSERRIVTKAQCWHLVDLNVPYDDPRFQAITFRADRRCLVLAFDAADLMPPASGHTEVRLYVPDLFTVLDVLAAKGASVEPQPGVQRTYQ
jgi:hypothetical protein